MKNKIFKTILFFGFCLLASFSFVSIAAGSDPRSCLNDVGEGSCLWGTPDERTTYIGPYCASMAPKIERLSVAELSKSSGVESENANNDANLNLGGSGLSSSGSSDWSKLNEVGTIWGTDGKLYRYTFAQGVEPRRVVENGVERIVWEQVLIRVLRPVKKEDQASAQGAATNAASVVVPCAPAQKAQPCAPATTTATNSTSPNVASGSLDSDGILSLSVVTQERNSTAAQKGKPVLVLPIEAKKVEKQNQRSGK